MATVSFVVPLSKPISSAPSVGAATFLNGCQLGRPTGCTVNMPRPPPPCGGRGCAIGGFLAGRVGAESGDEGGEGAAGGLFSLAAFARVEAKGAVDPIEVQSKPIVAGVGSGAFGGLGAGASSRSRGTPGSPQP